MRSTFKVLFYLKRSAPKKNGLIPVMCRITVNGKIAQFSCKLDVEEKTRNVESGRVPSRRVTHGNRAPTKNYPASLVGRFFDNHQKKRIYFP